MAKVWKLVLLIVLTLIFYALDYVGNPCPQQKWEAIPPLLFHHLIYAFVAIGWIFDSPFVLCLYIAAPIIIFFQHAVYHSCIVTDVTNKICETPGALYRDPLTIIGIKYPINAFVFSPLIVFGMCYAVYKLIRILRGKKQKGPTLNKHCDDCSFSCIAPLLSSAPLSKQKFRNALKNTRSD